jgi:hypothetical protein
MHHKDFWAARKAAVATAQISALINQVAPDSEDAQVAANATESALGLLGCMDPLPPHEERTQYLALMNKGVTALGDLLLEVTTRANDPH